YRYASGAGPRRAGALAGADSGDGFADDADCCAGVGWPLAAARRRGWRQQDGIMTAVAERPAPSAPGRATAAGKPAGRRIDAVTILTVWVVLLMAIPASLVV